MERKYLVLIIALFSQIAFGVSVLSYPPISGIFKQQFALTNAQSGFITSAFFLSYLLMQISGGYLADKFGPARSMLFSTFVMAGAPLIFVLGNSYAAAVASRLIGGIAGGILFPAEVRLLSHWFHINDLGRAMGIFGTGTGTSQVVASWILPLLILGTNWRPPILFAVGLSFVAGILIILPVRWTAEGRNQENTRIASKVKIDLRGLFTRNMFALMLPNFASVVIIYGIFAWTAQFLTSSFSISTSLAGSIVALIGVAAIIGAYAGNMCNRLLGKRPTLALSMVLSIIFTILLGYSSSIIQAAAWIFAIGFASILYFAADFSLIPYAGKQGLAAAGMTFGVFNTLSNIGTFTAPVLFGYILDVTGMNYQIGYITLAGIATLGLAGSILVRVDTMIAEEEK